MSNKEESEGEADLATLRRRRGQAKAAITKMITAANIKIRENEPEELKAVLESLDLAVTRLQETHRLYHDRLTEDIDKEESEAYEKVILMSVHDVRHDALAWLQEVYTPGEVDDQLIAGELDIINQTPPDDTDDDNPMSAELENLRALRKKEQENFELLLRRNKEEFELELQRMHHKAELDAQILHNQQKIQAVTTDLYSTPKAGKSPSTTRPSLSPISEDSISHLLELSRQQYQAQVDSLRLPPTNMIKFNGDPLQYWKFMRLFTTMVDKESVAAEEKLTRLHQYTEGKAQDAVSHCLYNPDPSAGFKEALERLKTRFGNPHTISQAWVEKVLNFKEIRDNKTTQQTQSTQSPNVTCGFAGAGNGKVCLPIVPVVVRGKASNISSVTYALLDPGANTSLVSEELTKKLKVKGKPARLDLDTVGGSQEGIFTRCVNLEIDSLHDGNMYTLNGVRTLRKLNIGLSCLATPDEVARWDHLAGIPIPSVNSDDVHLVIGQDAPRLLRAEEYRVGGDNDPYATRTVLGWAINGPIDYKEGGKNVKAYFLKSDHSLQMQVERFWKLDDPTQKDSLSINDQKVIKQWENSVSKDGSHYILDIPFKNEAVALPNNVNLAAHRLQLLERRLTKNADLQMKYVEAMKSTINNGYAEAVPASFPDRNDGKVWYLPHHPVIHPRKPEKVRVVFDCAAKYDGVSLNDVVHQGPDLTNKLITVLIRFRQGPIAMMADIEGMFNQIYVTPDHRDILRFLWWKDHDQRNEVVTYRMTSHLFGGVWSPSAASFALRKCASDHAHLYDADTISTVERNFYVDDCLKSSDSPQQAIHLAAQLTNLLKQGGFHLTKWTSNSAEVLKSIPEQEHAKRSPSLDLDQDPPMERALGVLWDIKNDCLTFSVNVKGKPSTKRGMLSTISSVYDPLGLAGPFILRGKALFQSLCRMKLGWDETIPSKIAEQWGRWLDDLPRLCKLQIPRCLRPTVYTVPSVTMQLHHFSDASELGYGAVSYLRLVCHNNIYCNIIMSRNRLAPVKTTTIPRLELAAAVVAVQLDLKIHQSFELPLLDSVFWTDSTIVLHYIRNEDKRYQTFVANRISQIHEVSAASQWKYICTEHNPADDVSRGLSAEELASKECWHKGPAFLWQREEFWPLQPELGGLPSEAEVKKSSQTYTISSKVTTHSAVDCFFHKYSSWYKLKRAIALILRAKDILLKKMKTKLCAPVTLNDLKRAEISIIDYVQRSQITKPLRVNNLRKLAPVRLSDGLLRVGGRLTNAPIPEAAKHPVILPQKHHVSELIIWHFHKLTGHSGVERVLSEIRQSFWIVRGRITVKRVLARCIPCKRHRAPISTQYMADLPADRVTPSQPPFTIVGVDYFGPINIRRGRSEVKRYGCLFTCLTTRAIHLEVAHSLDTDSFINALQRFMARRGTPQLMRSDNGSNFVGARSELQKALDEWNQQKIEEHLLQRETQWKFNPPAASHMGGVWERQIRTVRSILMGLTGQQTLDDEGLMTLFCIIEKIVNGRPLTKLSEDPRDGQPLTPNDLLLLRPECSLPPGHFVKQDLYRRRWRQVQYLADIFWTRWTKEYLPSLQQRQKWTHHSRNYQVGDLVLVLHESTPRSQWPLGLVIDVNVGADGLVGQNFLGNHKSTNYEDLVDEILGDVSNEHGERFHQDISEVEIRCQGHYNTIMMVTTAGFYSMKLP
ncbi:uncharacterized protein LOC115777334 [Archocentrus centrarchus]|uniref:uncharacterized protein LOC115777334 n=1 Tax=Archocentrus centrarchus TaxID=63155 RepID=UPI0011E9B919|nr:uncharacterized protein LOC115777334 [Archocentrus centrarchus]